jgi:glycosyltransferase involved in cell wall biosynthesis
VPQSVIEIGIIIPAYNPNPVILLDLIFRIFKVLQSSSFRLVVIDDGSVPAVQMIQKFPEPVFIIRHEKNYGKGQALKTGFNYFTQTVAARYILTIDADLQHPPEKIPDFLRQIRQSSYQIVVGCRERRLSQMPFHRILSNYLTSLIISGLTGRLIKDSQCGFRLLDSAILAGLSLEENRFHLESEMLIKTAWRKIRIGFVQVPTIYLQEKSSINNFRDTLNFISLIFRLLRKRMKVACIPF